MNIKEVLISGLFGGLIVLIISQIVSYTTQMVLPYNVLALGGMRSITDPIMILFFAHPWVLSFCVAIAYQYLKPAFEKCKNKAKCFGLMLWLIAGLPSAFLVWSSMNYPLGFTISSAIGSLLYFIALAYVIVKNTK